MKRAEKRLRWEQRKLSRKYRKGPESRNFRKQKLRVARAHERAANMRRDFLHKTSTAVGETQAVVYVEDLKIRNMTKSARGTAETPGRNVRQKSGLNRSILSQGWGTFLSLLEYRLERNGGRLVRVDPRNTSRTCFACGRERREKYTQGGARPQRLFGGSVLRTGGLTVQAVRSIPVSKRGVGRKESSSFPRSRRARREEGEDVKRRASILVSPVTEEIVRIALEAWWRYGKGRHAAGLNFGDCFSYDLSKATGEPLLFKGKDFAKTDLPSAL